MLLLGVPSAARVILAASTEGGDVKKFESSNGAFETIWPAYPGSVMRDFGVRVVPLVYLIQRQTVLASGIATSEDELTKLLEAATEQVSERVDSVPVP